eukprot:scaffold3917_cov377-Prasinococcus_capsulatus_cf.AAC.18
MRHRLEQVKQSSDERSSSHRYHSYLLAQFLLQLLELLGESHARPAPGGEEVYYQGCAAVLQLDLQLLRVEFLLRGWYMRVQASDQSQATRGNTQLAFEGSTAAAIAGIVAMQTYHQARGDHSPLGMGAAGGARGRPSTV